MKSNDFVPSEYYGDWKEKIDKKQEARGSGREWKSHDYIGSSKSMDFGATSSHQEQQHTKVATEENQTKDSVQEESTEQQKITDVEQTENMEDNAIKIAHKEGTKC